VGGKGWGEKGWGGNESSVWFSRPLHKVIKQAYMIKLDESSHLEGSRILIQKDPWILKMEPIDCPETTGRNYHYSLCNKMGRIGCPEPSVRNYHYSLRNNPKERSSHLLRDESLKSRKEKLTLSFVKLRHNICIEVQKGLKSNLQHFVRDTFWRRSTKHIL